jgi:hypothetical protein
MMKNAIYWDGVPCKFCENRCFGENYCLNLQGREIRERRNTLVAGYENFKSYTSNFESGRNKENIWIPVIFATTQSRIVACCSVRV